MNVPEHPSGAALGASRELLSFRVADTEFAFPVRHLCEVIERVEIMRIEPVPSLAEGIINYRGTVIPVVDARRALGFSPAPPSADGYIVITDVGDERTGLIVDAVHDVLAVPEAAIELPRGRVPMRRFVCGIAKLDGRMLLILDIGALLDTPPDEHRPALARSAPVDDADAAEARAVLRQRALALAQPVDSPDARRSAMVTTVCFAIAGGTYGLRAEFAKEIVMPPAVTPIPCTPRHVLGAVNIRGAIVPVLDLTVLLGLDPSEGERPGDSRIIVAEVQHVVVGLRVDEVVGICEFDAADMEAPMEAIDAATIGFIEGEFDQDGKPVCAIDLEAILRALDGAADDASVAANRPGLGSDADRAPRGG